VVLLAGTLFGLSSGAILPLAVLIFLGLLTIMEKVATFEIKRANKILRTDFQIVPNWFSSPFFSWNGLKERVTSLRSWMAIAYVFIIGIVCFASSNLLMTTEAIHHINFHFLWPVTPLGGLLFVIAWLMLAHYFFSNKD
jgi:hypothetical protein